MITSTAIDTPDAVDAAAGIPAVGMPVPAPTLPRAELPPRRAGEGTRGAVARNDVGRLARTTSRRSLAVRPKPARAKQIAPTTARAAATASPNEPTFHGTLSIRSEPLGALVWVDGELIGATPLILKKVVAGSRVVRIESGGYERWSAAARVVANKETSILASLQRASDQ